MQHMRLTHAALLTHLPRGVSRSVKAESDETERKRGEVRTTGKDRVGETDV